MTSNAYTDDGDLEVKFVSCIKFSQNTVMSVSNDSQAPGQS